MAKSTTKKPAAKTKGATYAEIKTADKAIAFANALEALQLEIRKIDNVQDMQHAIANLMDETNVANQILRDLIAQEGAPA